ncbi:MAG: S-methyl-5-thioribose-1-phosphate isomerase [Syntrophomonas sp.]|nr:S-methyl-5-thioribose-1-phosphate isomerase [Syntrophomonas sp.]
MIRKLYFGDQAVMILNQNCLPEKLVHEKCESPEEVVAAIKSLKVRGAPLIGVTAAFGLAMAFSSYSGTGEQRDVYFSRMKEFFASARPTAVNLFWALERMERVYRDNRHLSTEELAGCLRREAESLYEEDIRVNEAIGEYGQELLSKGSRVMTICNAGALATCGYGTALGVVRSAARRNKIEKVWACETRPVLQGSRLTVWELCQDAIPVTLLTDSMAGYTMSLGQVDAVITGADRIAANGDTANKIGTYSLAVLAKYHGIPFYVAAPLSTFDWNIEQGGEIPIEERSAEEVRTIKGSCLTVPAVDVFNPAFDITPEHLITAIICEEGIIRPPFGASMALWGREGE